MLSSMGQRLLAGPKVVEVCTVQRVGGWKLSAHGTNRAFSQEVLQGFSTPAELGEGRGYTAGAGTFAGGKDPLEFPQVALVGMTSFSFAWNTRNLAWRESSRVYFHDSLSCARNSVILRRSQKRLRAFSDLPLFRPRRQTTCPLNRRHAIDLRPSSSQNATSEILVNIERHIQERQSLFCCCSSFKYLHDASHSLLLIDISVSRHLDVIMPPWRSRQKLQL